VTDQQGTPKTVAASPVAPIAQPEPAMRASDADRDAVAGRLRAASEDGRLDVDELEDRLAQAYAAKTYGELAPLTADLEPATSPLPGALRGKWRAWASSSVLLLGIWAVICVASGGLSFFWPIFPIGFWAFGLIAGTIRGDEDDTPS
jgi:hypothetical protein